MKILLAIDHSPGSQAAICEIASRLWPAGTACEVLAVVEPPHLWTVSEVVESMNQSAQELVQGTAEQLQARGLRTSPLVLSGDPKAVIVDRAEQTGADLVVVGSHGNTGLTHFLMGSVAKAVIRFAPCSVEIARASTRNRTASTGIKILLASDGSPCSLLAARSIAELVWPEGSVVRIVSVAEVGFSMLQAASARAAISADVWPGAESPSPDPAVSGAIDVLREQALEQAQEAIRAAQEILAPTGLQSTVKASFSLEAPKQVILDEASQWGADLIVLGSHGRRPMDRFLLGSVSEAVATHAECSVEVVRGSV